MRNCKRRPRPKLAHRSYHPHCVAGKRFSWCKHSEIGYNYRLSNVLAGIGLGQLEALAERVQRESAQRRLDQSNRQSDSATPAGR